MESLNPAQAVFIDAFRSGQYKWLCAAGSTGSGKTVACLGLLHLLACKMTGMRFAIFRKSEKNLKQTTIPSYNLIKRFSRSSGESFIIDMVAHYPETGSEILFIWADISKDPDIDNVRGLELDGALIEEANQIDERYFTFLQTRVGRWSRKIRPFIIVNLNPSVGWCKDLFYTPWSNGNLASPFYFQEFNVEDNPKLKKEYIESLENLPDNERSRFVNNNWNYEVNPNQLIRYEWYRQCILDEELFKWSPTERNILSCDVADEGNNRTVIGHGNGNRLWKWEVDKKTDPTITGRTLYARSQEYAVEAGDIVIDPIGVGAGTKGTLRHHGIYPSLYYGAKPPTDKLHAKLSYHNLDSQVSWWLREAMQNQEIEFAHNPILQKEVLAMEYLTDKGKIQIASKKVIKKKLRNQSPDFWDTLKMWMWKYKRFDSNVISKILEHQTVDPYISRAERERAMVIRSQRIGL